MSLQSGLVYVLKSAGRWRVMAIMFERRVDRVRRAIGGDEVCCRDQGGVGAGSAWAQHLNKECMLCYILITPLFSIFGVCRMRSTIQYNTPC